MPAIWRQRRGAASRKPFVRKPWTAALLVAVAAFPGVAWADVAAGADDLARLSLEELAQVEITSVSLQPEPLREAAAAIFVISAEDIRRSGVTSLPEVLRLAPNLEVARIDSSGYAISARGFNSRETSNKLLVLIDGRSIYTPLYSGVSWDAQEIPLGEIARIEVISGPGGSLYGANAVNGVINITTKSAHDSLGLRGGAGAGSDERRATVRYGAAFGETGAARVYVSAFDRDGVFNQTGDALGDDASGVQAGFRADWGGGADRFTLQGDAYDRRVANRDVNADVDLEGLNIVGRWTRSFEGGGNFSLQAYVDRAARDEPLLVSTETTWDVAAQHRFAPIGAHEITVGGGYRRIASNYDSDPAAVAFLTPAKREADLSNLFIHDRIALSDKLTLTLALKAEDSSVSGLEWLPGVRIGWTVDDRTFLWARAARAVRTPSFIDKGLTLPGFLEGGPGFDSETLWAYEVGYRGRPTAKTSLTVTAYFNDYDDLRTVDLHPATFLPVTFANSARGQVYGVEAWGSWDVTDRWRLSGGFAALHGDFEHKPGSRDITGIASRGDDPDWRGQVRSQFDLSDAVEFDVAVRAVDDRPSGVDGYIATDVRLGWQVNERIELSLAGFNIFDDRHVESDDAGRRREIGRSAFLRLRWRP